MTFRVFLGARTRLHELVVSNFLKACKRLVTDLLQTFKKCLRNIKDSCKQPVKKSQPFAPVVRLAIFFYYTIGFLQLSRFIQDKK